MSEETAQAGHNSGADEAELQSMLEDENSEEQDSNATGEGAAGERLRSFIQRVERLEEEKKTIADDIREVYAEAKANGFDPKIMRQVVRIRKMDAADRAEQEAILETYLNALGMLD